MDEARSSLRLISRIPRISHSFSPSFHPLPSLNSHYFQVATAHLLNTQSLHLPPLDVLSLVPEQWSIRTLETFLSRSLRRSTHERLEGQLVANLALAQNLEVMEDSWAKMRSMGGVLKESEDDEDEEMDGDGGDEEEGLDGEEKSADRLENEEKEKVHVRESIQKPVEKNLLNGKLEKQRLEDTTVYKNTAI